jgi:hypothetical protein
MEMHMSDEGEKRRLSVNDPIDRETLQKFEQLADARAQVAERLLQLEQDRIMLLATAKEVASQHRRMFQEALTARGLSPDTEVEIDAKTGQITPKEKPAEQPSPEA